jgi:hypothetical protein
MLYEYRQIRREGYWQDLAEINSHLLYRDLLHLAFLPTILLTISDHLQSACTYVPRTNRVALLLRLSGIVFRALGRTLGHHKLICSGQGLTGTALFACPSLSWTKSGVCRSVTGRAAQYWIHREIRNDHNSSKCQDQIREWTRGPPVYRLQCSPARWFEIC